MSKQTIDGKHSAGLDVVPGHNRISPAPDNRIVSHDSRHRQYRDDLRGNIGINEDIPQSAATDTPTVSHVSNSPTLKVTIGNKPSLAPVVSSQKEAAMASRETTKWIILKTHTPLCHATSLR